MGYRLVFFKTGVKHTSPTGVSGNCQGNAAPAHGPSTSRDHSVRSRTHQHLSRFEQNLGAKMNQPGIQETDGD